MQPSIGVSYDSQAGKGVMGIGWGLNGLSAIARCPRTIAEDGYVRGVDYTSADAYCFNGARMVHISGNEYRTKNSNAEKILVTSGGFEVHSRNGVVTQYGLTEDSKIQAQGKSSIAEWLINRVTDKFGNYYTYTYQEDNANGDYRIDRIDYTGNTGAGVNTGNGSAPAASTFASVRFDYNDMYSEDVDVSYRAGSKQTTLKMLKNINTYIGESLVKNYRFIYSYSNNTDTRLSKIYECMGAYSVSGDCKRPLEITWNAETTNVFGAAFNGVNSPVGNNDATASKDIARIKHADFNGDGRTDIYYFNEGGTDTVYISNGSGGYSTKNGIYSVAMAGGADWNKLAANQILFGDFNGDGRSDIYHIQGRLHQDNQTCCIGVSQDYIYFANSDGSFSTSNRVNALDFNLGNNVSRANLDLSRIKMGDFNGDGRTDIYYVRGWNESKIDTVYLSNGNGTFNAVNGLNTFVDNNHGSTDIAKINVGDFNGDGLSDIYRVNGWQGHETYIDTVYLSNGNGAFTTKQTNINTYVHHSDSDSLHDVARVKFADFNGDGLTDVYRVNAVNTNYANDTIWISKGDGLFNQYTVQGFQTYVGAGAANASLDISRIVPGDFNGDGKADIYYVKGWGPNSDHTDFIYTYERDGKFKKAVNGLNTYIHNSASAASVGVSRLKFGDFNGDGGLGVYLVNGWGSQYSTQDKITPTLINSKLVATKITDGFDNETELTYSYLSEAGQTAYTKYNSGSYPTQNFQGPMRVVTSKKTTDGLNGNTVTTYKYEGARVNLHGRGQLGFARSIVTNLQTNLVTDISYNQTYPYIGMVSQETQKLNGKYLSYIENTPATFSLGGGREIIYLSNKEVRSYNINVNGAVLNIVNTESQINSNPHGDVTDVIVTTTDYTGTGEVYQTFTHNNYGHSHSGNFGLERLVTSNSVHKTNPLGASPTVIQNFTYDTNYYKLLSESGEVDDGTNPPHTGITKTYAYDAYGHINKTTITAPDITTRIVETEYDARGQFSIKMTNEMGHEAQTTYDSVFGVPLTKTGPNGLVTSYQYDSWGQLSDTYAPGGNSSHIEQTWCSINCQLPAINGSVDPQIVKFSTTTSVAGGVGATKYAPDVTVYYDKLGREIRKETKNFLNETILVDTAYDDLGRVIAQTQPYFAGASAADKLPTTNTYDTLNRVVSSTIPGEGVTTVVYTDQQYKVETTRTVNNPVLGASETQVSAEKKNVIGQVLYNTDNDGNLLHYEYDVQGNKIKTLMPSVDASGNIVDLKGTVVTINYDVFGRKTSMVDPNMGTWSYVYDSTSKLLSQTDALNQTTTMVYDRAGRMIERTDHDGRKSHWVYNDDLVNGDTPNVMAIGKLDSVYQTDSGSHEEYRQNLTYTSSLGLADKVTTIIEEGDATNSNKVTYETVADYDEYHRPNKVSYPETSANKRLELKYVYTEGTLTEVKKADDSVSYWQASNTNARGQVTLATYNSGSSGAIDITKGHDEAGRVTLIDYADVGDNTLYSTEYNYDELGTLVYRKSLRSNATNYLTEKYYYDSLQRLTSVERTEGVNTPTTSHNYSYDVLGNMRSKTGLGNYEYNSAKPHAVSRVNGVDYTYNANGALQVGGGRSVTWTAFNKPSTISNTGGFSSFNYGPSRGRYKQLSREYATATEPQKDITTIYLGGSYEKVTEDGVTKHKHYIKVGGNTIAQHTVEQTATNTVGTDKLEYLLRDNQGSTVAVVDDAGATSGEMDYDPFGARRPIMGSGVITSIVQHIPRGYTGHEHLDKLGLIHMNGRVYDPQLGRFLSADPIVQFSKNIQSYNRFSYVLNNPMSYTDPSGFSLKSLLKKAGRFIGKNVSYSIKASVIGQLMHTKAVRKFFLKYKWARMALQVGAGVADYFGCMGFCSAYAAGYITEISGGSYGDIGKAAVISGGAAYLGGEIGAAKFGIETSMLAHGAVGALAAKASGGNVGQGFFRSALGAGIGTKDVVMNALIKGAISKLTGGEFVDGAVASLFGAMLRDVGKSMGLKPGFGSNGTDCKGSPNPINIATGEKYLTMLDYKASGASQLKFERYYSSYANEKTALGYGWRSNYDRSLSFENSLIDHSPITIVYKKLDREQVVFTKDKYGEWLAEGDDLEKLIQLENSWIVTTTKGETESYNAQGQLQSIEQRGGYTQVLSYNQKSQLTKVSDSFNKTLQLAYNRQGLLKSVTDPEGSVTHYRYDMQRQVLTKVLYPDNTETLADNAYKQYHYNDARFTHSITE